MIRLVDRPHTRLATLLVTISMLSVSAWAQTTSVPFPLDLITEPWTGDFDGMVSRRRIRMLTPYSRTHYFIDKGVPRGIAFDAALALERVINRKLGTTPASYVHVVIVPTPWVELHRSLVDGGGDIVAAPIPMTPAWAALVDLTVAVRADANVAWAVRKGSPKLLVEVNAFLRRHNPGIRLGDEAADRSERATSDTELPRFAALVDLFRQYADRYGLDYLLMMAQGYQESRLDQRARSLAGAIGIMQVMPGTGRELDVGDIRQTEPNIHAGVKYIRQIIDRHVADDSVDVFNRTLFAFAAYNCGPTRLRQLRTEARRRGLNPNVWFGQVERVAAERVGGETVRYVSNIYKYYVGYALALQRHQHSWGALAIGGAR